MLFPYKLGRLLKGFTVNHFADEEALNIYREFKNPPGSMRRKLFPFINIFSMERGCIAVRVLFSAKLLSNYQNTPEDVLANFKTVIHHDNPYHAAHALCVLQKKGLLTPANRELIQKSLDPWPFVQALIKLQPHGLLDHSLSKVILEKIAAHKSPWEAADVLISAKSSRLLTQTNIPLLFEILDNNSEYLAIAFAIYIFQYLGFLNHTIQETDLHQLLVNHTNLFNSPPLRRLWLESLPTLNTYEMKCVLQQPDSDAKRTYAIELLLNKPKVFAFANSHSRTYQEDYLNPFIADYLSTLRINFSTDEHPVELSQDRSLVGILILKNFIQNTRSFPESDFLFLLNISAIRDRAHHASNTLLRFALFHKNRQAIDGLFAIPAVANLAARNNFYNSRLLGYQPLQELARNDESSMVSLSAVEQSMVDSILERYRPTIKAWGGKEFVFDALRKFLQERYLKNPAKIVINNHVIFLPLDWEEFQALKLNKVQRMSALKAYYQNSPHTALRFLSIPNHWIDLEAPYTVEIQLTGQKYACFKSFILLITAFWLAAMDSETPPTDGHTIEERIETFINHIALIGRAHNWESPFSLRGKQPECDNLKPDAPSCSSGIKRRLLNSVIGHPLFQGLTTDLLEQELKSFVYNYYKQHIPDEHASEIMKAIQAKIDLNSSFEGIDLAEYNINPAEIEAFTARLKTKYGHQLSYFTSKINDFFKPSYGLSHLEKYYTSAGIDVLLENGLKIKKNTKNASSSHGLFKLPASSSVVAMCTREEELASSHHAIGSLH